MAINEAAGAVTWSCWGIMGAVWSLGALRGRVDRSGRDDAGKAASGRNSNDAASLAGLIIGIAVVMLPESLWRPVTSSAPALRWIGIVVMVVATVATVWARLALGDMWSSRTIAPAQDGLRTSGPYALTRHPIYTGVLGMLLGTALTQGLGRWLVLLVAVTIVLIAKIRSEERVLGSAFPGAYDRYREHVPALVPGLRVHGRVAGRSK